MTDNGSKAPAKPVHAQTGGFLGALVDQRVTNELTAALPLLRKRLEEGFRAAATRKVQEIRHRLEAEFLQRVAVAIQQRLDTERQERDAAFAATVEEEVNRRLDSFRAELEGSTSESTAAVSRMVEETLASLDFSLPDYVAGTTEGAAISESA